MHNAVDRRIKQPALILAPLLGAVVLAAVAAPAAAWQAGETFRDCADCPEMVVMPLGAAFMMGSDGRFHPDANPGERHAANEGPRHTAIIVKAFALGKHEVTQAEWMAVMGTNPSAFPDPSRPVEQVSWDDAQAFIRRLSAKTGKTYRLPSETEWEYAARAGTSTPWSWGAPADQAGLHAWYDSNAGGRTHPVGQLLPNAFGLHDMHGNVAEWVQDCWHATYRLAPIDGSAWQDEADCLRVFRGGFWGGPPPLLRSSARGRAAAGDKGSAFGFRVARTLLADPP